MSRFARAGEQDYLLNDIHKLTDAELDLHAVIDEEFNDQEPVTFRVALDRLINTGSSFARSWRRKKTGRGKIMATTTGFFVDWDGDTKRVEAPGDGFTCRVVSRSHLGVDVIDEAGFFVHEATYFPNLAAVKQAGVKVKLV